MRRLQLMRRDSQGLFGPWRRNECRRDGVHRNAIFTPFDGKAFGQMVRSNCGNPFIAAPWNVPFRSGTVYDSVIAGGDPHARSRQGTPN
jgi:hypothetical protein